jgi:hypothetical protein
MDIFIAYPGKANGRKGPGKPPADTVCTPPDSVPPMMVEFAIDDDPNLASHVYPALRSPDYKADLEWNDSLYRTATTETRSQTPTPMHTKRFTFTKYKDYHGMPPTPRSKETQSMILPKAQLPESPVIDAIDEQHANLEYDKQDFSMPKSVVLRLAKGVLPPNTQIAKDAQTALWKSATVFVSYLASQ